MKLTKQDRQDLGNAIVHMRAAIKVEFMLLGEKVDEERIARLTEMLDALDRKEALEP